MIEIPLALFAAARVATAGQGTEPPAPPEDVIIVNGETNGRAKAQSQTYVRALGIAQGDLQTSRWFEPICPRAIGIPDNVRRIIEQQVRQTIRSVAAPLASPRCKPNLIIGFTDDAPKLVQRLRRTEPSIGSELPARTVEALTSGDQPIRWWYTTEVRSRDGATSSSVMLPWVRIETDGGFGTLPSNGSSLPLYGSSVVSTQSVRAIQEAVVIVDVARSSGLKLKPVVDYATLVALAETRPGAAPAGSVLSIFSHQDSGADGLTARDLSFLRTLYDIPMDRSPAQQRRSLVSAMTKDGRVH